MEGGPSDFPQGFSCLVVLWILLLPIAFVYGAFTLYGLTSQTVPLTNRFTFAVLNPSMHARWFGPVSYTHLDVYKRQALHAFASALDTFSDGILPFVFLRILK